MNADPCIPGDGQNRILFVDDNAVMCDMMRELLEELNYEVHIAFNGFQGLKIARRMVFDVAVINYGMPGMNGIEMFKEFRKISPETPAILTTAFCSDEIGNEAVREGFRTVLTIPYKFGELLELIETLRTPNI